MILIVVLISVLALLISSNDAAVISHEDNLNTLVEDSWYTLEPKEPYLPCEAETPRASRSVLKGFSKFALVTTGTQVKLYPISSDNQQKEKYFLIKILDNRYDEDSENLRSAEKRIAVAKTNESKSILPTRPSGIRKKSDKPKASIVPGEGSDDDFMNRKQVGHFWISDVNYAFGPEYCSYIPSDIKIDDNLADECMVLIYVDAWKNRIGFAHLLLKNDEGYLSETHDRQPVLWAKRYSYIDASLRRGYTNSLKNTELAMDHGNNILYANLQLPTRTGAMETVILRHIIDEQIDVLKLKNNQVSMGNLNIVANWLFYMVYPFEFPSRKSQPSSLDAVDIELNESMLLVNKTIVLADNNPKSGFKSSGYVPDLRRERAYWITEHNQLMGRHFFANYIVNEGELPNRLKIKEPGRTEIVDNLLYFSDSGRRLFQSWLPYRGVQLLLIEDRLVNFRIGVTPAHFRSEPSYDLDEEQVMFKPRSDPPSSLRNISEVLLECTEKVKDSILENLREMNPLLIFCICILICMYITWFFTCICGSGCDESMILPKKALTYDANIV